MTALMELDQASRAAVMIMLLDEEQATQILSQLEPDELKVLGERMCTLGDIDPGMITKTVSDFLSRTDQVGMPAADRARQVDRRHVSPAAPRCHRTARQFRHRARASRPRNRSVMHAPG